MATPLIAPTKYFSGLWHVDGNVIINTYESGICYEFRVHASLLSLHSSWWAHVLSIMGYDIPRGARPSDHVAVDIHSLHWFTTDESDVKSIDAGFDPDPFDFAALLMRIYEPYTLWGPHNDALASDQAYHLLRLANLYGMHAVCVEIQTYLSKSWPSTLEQFDMNERAIFKKLTNLHSLIASELSSASVSEASASDTAEEEQVPAPPSLLTNCPPSLPDPSKLISVARKYGLQSLLPCAFYALSRLRLHDRAYNHLAYGHIDPSLPFLSSSDFRRLVYGRERIQDRSRGFAISPLFVDATDAGCVHCYDTPCSIGIRTYWYQRVTSVILQGLDDPLSALTTLMEEDNMRAYGVCDACIKAVKARIGETRLEWWGSLSEDFSIHED